LGISSAIKRDSGSFEAIDHRKQEPASQQSNSMFRLCKKRAVVKTERQSWNRRKQNLPKLTFPNLSVPFCAFSNLFKPWEKPKSQTKLKNKPETQSFFSDRRYRRKIATEQKPLRSTSKTLSKRKQTINFYQTTNKTHTQ
jgi:hypothetical protein